MLQTNFIGVSVENWHINVYVDRYETMSFFLCVAFGLSQTNSTQHSTLFVIYKVICNCNSCVQFWLKIIRMSNHMKHISILCLWIDWHNEMQPTLEWHNESLFWLRCVNLLVFFFCKIAVNCRWPVSIDWIWNGFSLLT